jgi:hypothetical protein
MTNENTGMLSLGPFPLSGFPELKGLSKGLWFTAGAARSVPKSHQPCSSKGTTGWLLSLGCLVRVFLCVQVCDDYEGECAFVCDCEWPSAHLCGCASL